MTPSLRRLRAAVLAAACTAAGVAADFSRPIMGADFVAADFVGADFSRPGSQTPSPAAGEPISIDFFATGPDGLVFDLRPEEITLKVDGRTREIRSLRYISLPSPDSARPTDSRVELDPPYGSNIVEAAGRWVTIVVDHESIRTGSEKNVMSAAVRFVNALGPRDRVSYLTAPRGGVEVHFTTEHDKVVSALRRFIGRAPREESERDRSCRSRLLLHAMRDLLEDITPIEGPKIVAVLSAGVLNPRRDAPLDAPPGMCEIRLEDFQNVRVAAAQSRAQVFVIQPDHLEVESARNAFIDPTLSRFAGADADRAGLESLAGAAAGEFHRIVGPDDTALLNFARATAGYYIATFEPKPSERNGTTHRVSLDVKREGVRVRVRPEVLIPRLPQKATSTAARDMLRDSILYRALPLRAVAYTSASEGAKVKVMAAVEPTERGVKLVSAVFGLFDESGVLVAQWTADSRELATLPLVTAGEALPGPYRLRVAAIDSTGRQGKVEYEFLARLTDAGPLTLSAIALGTSRDSGFTPKLVFGTDQAAVVFLEAYGTLPKADSLSARVEIATGPDDRALQAAAPRVLSPAPDRHMIIGALPIAALPPGDYVVRAIVSVDGRPVGRVLRTIRKTPSGS